jgi:hypothetical protein
LNNLRQPTDLNNRPHVIAKRRRIDVGREPPHRDVPTLEQHQHLAEAQARCIAQDLGRPFILIADGQLGSMLDFFSGACDRAVL